MLQVGFRLVATLAATVAIAAFPLQTRSIPEATFDDLVFYFQYASSAYSTFCLSPNGNTLVAQFTSLSGTQGYVARDDTRKEIVIALRGSSSILDFITDADVFLTAYESPGVTAPSGTEVHSGFLEAYNSVADTIISTVRAELKAHAGYNLVTSGHSLGGALSSLAAVSLKSNFPSSQVTMFTYGQPRTGNPSYAFWVNELLGDRVFRGVHTTDGVPTIIPQAIGYRHHGIEYWSNPDGTTGANTKMCAADGEDPTCSDSIPSAGIDLAHTVYYGILALTPFCI
ncbi:alpha/beta-hydrolase [Hysterangium stoloniferum]|nr:alpha/beta-hydrolase [Hysterangium stoloniferum]